MTKPDPEPERAPAKPRLTPARLAPLLVVAAAFAAAIIFDVGQYLSLRFIAERQDALLGFVAENLALAVLLYMGVYILAVAASLPGASILTVLGGYLFGVFLGPPIVVVSATIGATLIFLVAKTALGDALASRAGGLLDRLKQGFQEDAASYLLFLRLVPAFPFWLVNIAPAFAGVGVVTFAATTFFGIIPGTTAYVLVGGGLGSILESARSDPDYQACLAQEAAGAVEAGSCRLPVSLGDFVTTELIVAAAALGVVALIPPVVRKLRGRKRPAADQA